MVMKVLTEEDRAVVAAIRALRTAEVSMLEDPSSLKVAAWLDAGRHAEEKLKEAVESRVPRPRAQDPDDQPAAERPTFSDMLTALRGVADAGSDFLNEIRGTRYR